MSLWLCSNTIRWDERLRRFSQLHLKAAYTVLKATGIDPRNAPGPSTVDKDIILSFGDCHTLIDWVKPEDGRVEEEGSEVRNRPSEHGSERYLVIPT